jgi:hypothetical protein
LQAKSIYEEEFRLAQPDEVWNYRTGDGLEQAILLACILKARSPEQVLTIETDDGIVSIIRDDTSIFSAKTAKSISTNLIQI